VARGIGSWRAASARGARHRLAARAGIGYAHGMRIEFVKMQALGNDFFVFDARHETSALRETAARWRMLADRHRGVGFDQALMLEAPRSEGTRAFYRIFNADGSEVEQCGNGARCLAALLYARRPELGRDIELECPGGRVRARVLEDGRVRLDMGAPDFEPRSLPMDASAVADVYRLEAGDELVEVGAVSIGNPHAVLTVPNVETARIAELGPRIERHPRFPRRTNVGFMQIVDRSHILLRVFERGVGETCACGTGACAAVAVGRRRGLLEPEVRVDLPGGPVEIAWRGDGASISLTGPALHVFDGTIDV
jgi:diaminopimelate epimerase